MAESRLDRVIVIESNPSGHRLYYVALLADAARERGLVFEWWTCSAAQVSPEAEVHLGHRDVAVRLVETGVSRVGVLRMALRDERAWVVIPDGDSWLTGAVVACARGWVGAGGALRILLMRPPIPGTALSRRSALRHAGKRGLVRTLTALSRATRADLGLTALRDPFGYGLSYALKGVVALRDPVPPRAALPASAARAQLGLPADGIVVALVGAVDDRKNPYLVASGCAAAFVIRPGVLLVAGRLGEGVLQDLLRAGLPTERLVVRPGYVDEETLLAAVSAADALALMYSNHGSSSGILAIAAQCGTPVVVPAGTVLADVVKRGQLGTTSAMDEESLAVALLELVNASNLEATWGLEAAAQLTVGEFQAGLLPPR